MGDWCIDRFSNNYDHDVIPYHWSDHKVRKKNLEQLYITYEYILKRISNQLNVLYLRQLYFFVEV